MGDRAVIGFKATRESQPLWLYSHWGGSDRYSDLCVALEAAKPRWGDPSYATRIAVSSIVGNQWAGELGFGLSVGDDGFPAPDWDDIPVVIWEDLVVEICTRGECGVMPNPITTLEFAEFLTRAKSDEFQDEIVNATIAF